MAERKRMVRELRHAGRAEDARALAGLRKPTAVVLAVNRAARDRPQAARDAARAAEELAKTQLSGPAEKYARARTDWRAPWRCSRRSRWPACLERSLRPRRCAVGSPISFGPQPPTPTHGRHSSKASSPRKGTRRGSRRSRAWLLQPRKRPAAPSRSREAGRREKQRRDREQRLEAELAHAEEALEAAKRSLAAAQRGRDKAARAVTTASERLERLQES